MAELARKEGKSPGIKTKKELKTRAGIRRACAGSALGRHGQGEAVGLSSLGIGFYSPCGDKK